MQSLKSALYVRHASKRISFNCKQFRCFSSTQIRYNEDHGKNIKDFPWLLSKDEPRIKKYPFDQDSSSSGLINILPNSIQHAISNWLGTRILQLNTGFDNFPDQFLVGASLATRQAVSLLSDQLKDLKDDSQKEKLHDIFTPDILDRFLKAAPFDVDINIDIPQIYDVNLDNIWVTLGNSKAFSDDNEFEILRWRTIQLGLHKAKIDEDEESMIEYRQRISKSVLEGLQISVDVLIDADITYNVTSKEENDIVLHDEGRRTLRIKFVTPYFTPASAIVSSRDPETQEPVNDWNWRIGDIDQLIEKESMEQE